MLKLLILDQGQNLISYDSDAYIKSVEVDPLPVDRNHRWMNQNNRTVATATNQSGIARGYCDVATLEAMHAFARVSIG